MARIYRDITRLIGNTPLVRLNRMDKSTGAEILLKLEFFNPYGSVKDRIGLSLIEDAERKGLLKKGDVIVEATSGNTGISLAFVAAVKGYEIILTMPDTMTIERRNLLKALGAKLELTPGTKGMNGAVERANEIAQDLPRAWKAQQFENQANMQIHLETTGPEIWFDTDGLVDVLVSGVGTGGTLTGAGRFLKSKNPDLYVVAVEPADSPVLSGGKAGPHKIQGIGAGFVPSIYDPKVVDEVIQVSNEDSMETSRRLTREEGIFVGISTGAILWAAMRVAARPEFKGKTIVSIAPDFGERYLSNPLYSEIPQRT
ncbi:MAG: cysteine synthase A [Acidobacteriota bacterium]